MLEEMETDELISIHVLREEDDVVGWVDCEGVQISIHVLREEDDVTT